MAKPEPTSMTSWLRSVWMRIAAQAIEDNDGLPFSLEQQCAIVDDRVVKERSDSATPLIDPTGAWGAYLVSSMFQRKQWLAVAFEDWFPHQVEKDEKCSWCDWYIENFTQEECAAHLRSQLESPRQSHVVNWKLPNGAQWTQCLHSHQEQSWNFEYQFDNGDDIDHKVKRSGDWVINKIVLHLNYDHGLLCFRVTDLVDRCPRLSMHVILPERLREEWDAGSAHSPHKKIYCTFTYHHDPQSGERSSRGVDPVGQLHLAVIEIGTRRLDLKNAEDGAALFKPIDFPFPVPDTLECVYGAYQMPFLCSDGSIDHFDFPRDIHA